MGKTWAAGAALLLAACNGHDEHAYLGYAEGESVHVAAPNSGQLASLQAQRGQDVAVGAPLFALEQEREKAAVDEATHRMTQAQAQLELAQTQYVRQKDMRVKGLSSVEQLDAARTQSQIAQSRVDELNAQITEARWMLTQKTVTAPVAGVVDDVYYRVGEQVPAGTAVLSLLPPQNRKLRFFVPQSDLEQVKIGAKVDVRCDGCASNFAATVRFVAPQAEYTPPVIYSESARQKLLFLVEAWPEPADALKLRPGQPVEVRVAQSGQK